MRTERSAQVTTRDTQKLRLIRQRFSPSPAPCDTCGEHTQALSRMEAAIFAGLDLATIDELVETGRLHRTQGATGAPLICLDSLINDGHGECENGPETSAV